MTKHHYDCIFIKCTLILFAHLNKKGVNVQLIKQLDKTTINELWKQKSSWITLSLILMNINYYPAQKKYPYAVYGYLSSVRIIRNCCCIKLMIVMRNETHTHIPIDQIRWNFLFWRIRWCITTYRYPWYYNWSSDQKNVLNDLCRYCIYFDLVEFISNAISKLVCEATFNT